MDPALLHATLGLVALHRDILICREQSADSLYHKGQTIHAINNRFLSGDQLTNDENLGVIALLIKFEVNSLAAIDFHCLYSEKTALI